LESTKPLPAPILLKDASAVQASLQIDFPEVEFHGVVAVLSDDLDVLIHPERNPEA